MTTVLTYGVFDLFHEGHRRLLERAKALGDRLIVGVVSDQYAVERGKLSTVDPLEVRMANVRGCPFVDEVIVEDHHGQKAEDIRRFGADILAMGDDWLGKFEPLESLCRVIYLPRTPNISSSILRSGALPYLRIGIIGAGRIADRFVREAGFVRDVRISCVFRPDPDHSASLRNFISNHTSILKVRTLEKLFDQTDAVYIASPHETHFAYAKAALEAGKHVLCEKPLCLKKAEAQHLFDLAKEKGLVLMEAIKTAYCPGFIKLCGVAMSGYIGDIVDIECAFTRLTPPGVREWTDLRYGGSFTEFGSYILLPVVKLLGTKDLSWHFQSVRNADGLDIFTKINLESGSRFATGCCGLGAKSESGLVISGTKGYLLADAPWWKTRHFELRYEDPNEKKHFGMDFQGDGLRYEIADFLYRIQGHSGRDYRMTPEESICMAEIMESFLRER